MTKPEALVYQDIMCYTYIPKHTFEDRVEIEINRMNCQIHGGKA